MQRVVALILAGGRVGELSLLTLTRPKSAVPFGGMYRVIDFALSNLMHSGVERVGILSQYRSFSLINHVGVGASWDFVGRNRGATMLLPSTTHLANEWYKGTSDAVFQNLEFIDENAPDTVLIVSGDHIYSMDYRNMLGYHLDKDADLTIAFVEVDPKQGGRFGTAVLDDEDGEVGGRVTEYMEKQPDREHRWASMTVYMFKPDVLRRVLSENALRSSHEFGRDIIPSMVETHRVYGYRFPDYWGYTRTVDEYWKTSMDVVAEDSPIDMEGWQVRTNLDHDHLRDRPPARIAAGAEIENVIVQAGCVIEGKVRNSILFPGAIVERGAEVTDSVLFFDTVVGADTRLDKVIADFDVRIGRSAVIGEGKIDTPNADNPNILSSGITLIGKGCAVPDKIKIGRNCIIAPGLDADCFKEKKVADGASLYK